MRYDTKVIFQLVEDTYLANGDYSETVLEQHTEYASIQNTDAQTMHLVYGEIRQGSITLSLQNYVGYPFNRVLVNGKPYTVDQSINLRVKKAYILSEIPNAYEDVSY